MRAVVGLVLVCASACGPATKVAEGKQPPIPVLAMPARAVAGEPVHIDIKGSSDLDGIVAERQILFGDGTEPAVGPGEVDHVFATPGVYLVEAYLKDDDGLPARARRRIEITAP